MVKDSQSLKDAVYNSIIEDILNLEYVPGDIINEKSLVEKYNCSKSPVRDALQVLCSEYVLRALPRYGYEVVRITMDEIREMLQYRLLLECGILNMRNAPFSPEQLRRLAAINEKCQSDETDIWHHWNYNSEFHIRLLGFSGNSYATTALTNCMSRMKRAYAQLSWSRGGASLSIDTRNHSFILEALENNDLPTAKEFLKKDLDDFGILGNLK